DYHCQSSDDSYNPVF
nr:immunoglobulin light chain junction region [Macaca mulatta]